MSTCIPKFWWDMSLVVAMQSLMTDASRHINRNIQSQENIHHLYVTSLSLCKQTLPCTPDYLFSALHSFLTAMNPPSKPDASTRSSKQDPDSPPRETHDYDLPQELHPQESLVFPLQLWNPPYGLPPRQRYRVGNHQDIIPVLGGVGWTGRNLTKPEIRSREEVPPAPTASDLQTHARDNVVSATFPPYHYEIKECTIDGPPSPTTQDLCQQPQVSHGALITASRVPFQADATPPRCNQIHRRGDSHTVLCYQPPPIQSRGSQPIVNIEHRSPIAGSVAPVYGSPAHHLISPDCEQLQHPNASHTPLCFHQNGQISTPQASQNLTNPVSLPRLPYHGPDQAWRQQLQAHVQEPGPAAAQSKGLYCNSFDLSKTPHYLYRSTASFGTPYKVPVTAQADAAQSARLTTDTHVMPHSVANIPALMASATRPTMDATYNASLNYPHAPQAAMASQVHGSRAQMPATSDIA